MADAPPDYYPPGWDRERMLNSAANDELLLLTEEQRAAFRTGLRADLGDEGYDQFWEEMYRRETAAKDPQAPPPPIPEPPFMETMRLMEERRGADAHWNPWGFVIYKSPKIRDTNRWSQCRQRFEQILDDSLTPYRGYAGLDECLSRMQFRWVEDLEDDEDSIAAIANKGLHDDVLKVGMSFFSTHPLPGLNHSLCLYITPQSLESILNSPLPSTSKRQYRIEIPWVVAISADAAQANAGWRGYFKVAVEALLTSLFPVIADDMLSPDRLGGHVLGEDIWCDTTRWGVHKAGQGYWDRRTGQVGTTGW